MRSHHQRSVSFADGGRREFLRYATWGLGGIGLAAGATTVLRSLAPAADVRAAHLRYIDLAALGQSAVAWATWPHAVVYALRRSTSDLAAIRAKLADPDRGDTADAPVYTRNWHRSIRREIMVCSGLCSYDFGRLWVTAGALQCPWCGSKFDLAGRRLSGWPAASDLSIPPHRYIAGNRLEIRPPALPM